MTEEDIDALLAEALPQGHPDHPGPRKRTGRSGSLDALSALESVEEPSPQALQAARTAVRARLLQEPTTPPSELSPSARRVGKPMSEPRPPHESFERHSEGDPTPPARFRVRVAVGLALSLTGLLLMAVSKTRPPDLMPWLEAGVGLVAISLVGAWAAGSEGRRIAFAILGGLGAGLVVLSGINPGLAPLVGMKCFLFEQLTASVSVAVLWIVEPARRRRPPLVWAAVASAGAAAGFAALHVVCPAPGLFAHQVVFHLGGLLVAGVVVGLLGRWWTVSEAPPEATS